MFFIFLVWHPQTVINVGYNRKADLSLFECRNGESFPNGEEKVGIGVDSEICVRNITASSRSVPNTFVCLCLHYCCLFVYLPTLADMYPH